MKKILSVLLIIAVMLPLCMTFVGADDTNIPSRPSIDGDDDGGTSELDGDGTGTGAGNDNGDGESQTNKNVPPDTTPDSNPNAKTDGGTSNTPPIDPTNTPGNSPEPVPDVIIDEDLFGIYYDESGINDIIIPGKVAGDDGSKVESDDFYINLTKEIIAFPQGYKVTAYSIDGGNKWTAVGAKSSFGSAEFAKLLSKDLTLAITDKISGSGTKRKPAADAKVVSFAKINKRPSVGDYTVNYAIGADKTGQTAGSWVISKKNGSVSIKKSVDIALADGRNPNKDGYGRFYGEDGSANGIPVAELSSSNKAVNSNYIVRTSAKIHVNENTGAVTYTAASATKRLSVDGQKRPASYSVSKRNKTVKYSANTYVFTYNDDAPVLKTVKGEVNLSNYDGDIYLWSAATAGNPASAAQKTSVTPGDKEISYVNTTVRQIPAAIDKPVQITPAAPPEPTTQPPTPAPTTQAPAKNLQVQIDDLFKSSEKPTEKPTEKPAEKSAKAKSETASQSIEFIGGDEGTFDITPFGIIAGGPSTVTINSLGGNTVKVGSFLSYTANVYDSSLNSLGNNAQWYVWDSNPTTADFKPTATVGGWIATIPTPGSSLVNVSPIVGSPVTVHGISTPTPTTNGTVYLVAVVPDGDLVNPGFVYSNMITITVEPATPPTPGALSIAVLDTNDNIIATVPEGEAGEGYSISFRAMENNGNPVAGGTTTWTCSATGDLTAHGLTFNPTTGTITALSVLTAAHAGTVSFDITVKNVNGATIREATRSFIIVIHNNYLVEYKVVGGTTGGGTLQILNKTALGVVVANPAPIRGEDTLIVRLHNNVYFTAVPDSGYRLKQWTIDGKIVGIEVGTDGVALTPPGTAAYTSEKLDILGLTGATTVTVEFMAIPPIITTTELPKGKQNYPVAYSATLAATGINGTARWTWTPGTAAAAPTPNPPGTKYSLPSGLTLNTNGTITGKPTEAGIYKVCVKVEDVLTGNVVRTSVEKNLFITILNEIMITYEIVDPDINGEISVTPADSHANISPDPSGTKITIKTWVEDTVTFTATPNTGFTLKEWIYDPTTVGIESNNADGTVFTSRINSVMGEEVAPPDPNKLKVTVSFKSMPTTHTRWNVGTGQGTLQARVDGTLLNASEYFLPPGKSISFTAVPQSGYRVDTWQVVSKSADTPPTSAEYIAGNQSVSGNNFTYTNSGKDFVWVRVNFTSSAAPLIDILPNDVTLIPNGTLGSKYKFTFDVTNRENYQVLAWSSDVDSATTGLKLDPITGELSGTIPDTSPNPITLTVKVVGTLPTGNKAESSRTYQIYLEPPKPPVIITDVLPNGAYRPATSTVTELKFPYSEFIEYSGSTPTWELIGGALPAGLSLDTDTGEVHGEPTELGTFTFKVRATNSAGAAEKSITITIAPPTRPVVTTTSPLPGGSIGAPYTQQLAATGNPDKFTWSISAGSLPPGLALNPADGTISGTPTTAGSYTFTVGANNGFETGTKQFTVVISPFIIQPTPPNGEVGTAYTHTFNNISGMTWNIYTGIRPPGLTLNPNTGVLSGTPTQSGTYTFTVTAMYAGVATTRTFTVEIIGPAAPVITTKTLPVGEIDTPYDTRLAATGSTPITWKADGLPDGLTLNPANGRITGVPKETGTFHITVTATNSVGSATEIVTLVINLSPVLTLNPASPITVYVGLTKEFTVTVAPATLTNRKVTWEYVSGQNRANVSNIGYANGVTRFSVTGLSVGTTTIAITNNSNTIHCVIHVVYPPTIIRPDELTDGPYPTKETGGSYSQLHLPNATMNTQYNETLLTRGFENDTGTIPPIYWQIIGGTLPPGLQLTQWIQGTQSQSSPTHSGDTGTARAGCVIEGKPTDVGVGKLYTFIVEASEILYYRKGTATVVWQAAGYVYDDKTFTASPGSRSRITWADGSVIVFSGTRATRTINILVTPNNYYPVTGLTLDKSAMTLSIGADDTLAPVFTPANATVKFLIWQTSNPSVATVDQLGRVYGVSKGTAVITATTADGKFSATCTVTVKYIPVSGLNLNKNTMNLPVGGTDVLTPTVLPANATNKTVSFNSGNINVATVDEYGRIKAISAGTASITVTTADVNAAGAQITKNCTVIVQEAPPKPVTEILLNKTAITLRIGESETLTTSVRPADATNKFVSWSSNNNNVSIDAVTGAITAVNTGSSIVTVKSESTPTITTICTVTILANVPATKIELNKSVAVIPVGRAEMLAATLSPVNASTQNLIWQSIDPNIATVDSKGNVTGKAVGITKIRVGVSAELTVECTVEIVAPIASSANPSVRRFVDVDPKEWYWEYVEEAASYSLVKGIGNDRFAPERNVTRAEFVQMVYNALQLPKPAPGGKPFTDVSSSESGDWYYDAIMSARNEGLLDKFAAQDSKFYPNRPITREEMAVILAAVARREGFKDEDFTNARTHPDDIYMDSGMIKQDYKSDLKLVYDLELMEGKPMTNSKGAATRGFDPKGVAIRAEAATVMVRLYHKISRVTPMTEPDKPLIPEFPRV